MGMAAGGGGGLNSEINVTPMVDIMLVLLIIFMLVTPNLQQGVNVNIPTETSNAKEDKAISSKDSLVVSIPKDGEYYLGETIYPIVKIDDPKDEGRKRLQQVIKSEVDKKQTDEDKIVYIKSGIGVSYGEVVGMIDLIRDRNSQTGPGVTRVGLVADRRKDIKKDPPD